MSLASRREINHGFLPIDIICLHEVNLLHNSVKISGPFFFSLSHHLY